MPPPWILPGSPSPYLIVWWYDSLAKETHRHVSPSKLKLALRGWLHTRNQTVREIYDALEPRHPSRPTSRTQLDLLMKERLSEAFTSGKLVGLASAQAEVATHSPVTSATPRAGAQDKTVQVLGIVHWHKTPALRLRSSPEVGNNEIGSLEFNTTVQISAQLPGGWLAVSTLDGRNGFVSADYVWSAPKHPLPEPSARLHHVARGTQGTAIAIAEQYYGDLARTWGSDLRVFVAVLARVNQRPIPNTTGGWKKLAFQADEYIWIPSKTFAQGLRGKVNSGSYSHNALDSLGLTAVFQRMDQLLGDLGQAIWLSLQYIPKAVEEHVEQALRTILVSLLKMAVAAILFLAICTAVGAAFGALFGGAGAAPGAAAGYEIGLALLDWMGLAMLADWIVGSLHRLGSAFAKFLGEVWQARGNAQKLDSAARALADAIGLLAGILVEALTMWVAAKGATAAIKALKGTALERAFGETRLASWLKERSARLAEGKSPLPGPRQALGRLRERFKTPAPGITRLAEQAFPRYKRELEPARRQITQIFKDMGDVQARAKDPVSAANRLQRAIDKFGAKVTTVEEAISNLWDAIGTRLVLSETSPKAIGRVVSRLAEAIRRGELQITELNNLHGPGGEPYFSPKHLEALQVAAAQSGQTLRIGESKLMNSGYTVVCAYLKHANGVRGELQIIGPEVLSIANAEHIPYDVSLGKPLVRNVPPAAELELKELVKPVEAAMSSMSKAQQERYLEYLNQSYIHARKTELGQPSTPPQLPPDLSQVLSVEQIKQLERAIASIKARYQSH